MKTKEQIEYEYQIKNYKEQEATWCAKAVDATSCSYQYSDGKGEPDSLRCMKTKMPCTGCNFYVFNAPRPTPPKYRHLINNIPSYCEDCKFKKDCKNIEQNIIYCPNKVTI